MLRFMILPIAFASLAAHGATPPPTTRAVVDHHMTVAAAGNIDAVMLDYAEDAIHIAPDGIVSKGKTAIRKIYAALLAGPALSLVVNKSIFERDVGYITWTSNAGNPDEAQGSDTFVVRDGKIIIQTVVMVPRQPRKLQL